MSKHTEDDVSQGRRLLATSLFKNPAQGAKALETLPAMAKKRIPTSSSGIQRISTHRKLFKWLTAQLPEAFPKASVPVYFINEVNDVIGSFLDFGSFARDRWTLHYFFYETFHQPFQEKDQCSEALLWFLSQVYTIAAAEAGLSVPLETANQIAIYALKLNGPYLRIKNGEIRSTKQCRDKLKVSVQVALENEPYEVIHL